MCLAILGAQFQVFGFFTGHGIAMLTANAGVCSTLFILKLLLLILELLLHQVVQLHCACINPAILTLDHNTVEDDICCVLQDTCHVRKDDRGNGRYGLRGEERLKRPLRDLHV